MSVNIDVIEKKTYAFTPSGHMRSTGQKAVLPMLLAAQSLDSADLG